jgi:TP901 family phage tail tape measure protein
MPSSFDVTANVNLDPRSLNASAKKIELALGRITGQASEFQKSLDASTARVFAFGATTAVLNGVNQAFKKLVSTTIEVEKKLVEINSIFQASEKVFNRFRNSIFQVAKETGQAFGTVSEGAAELARQGLSAEETAKRLKASLVLTRISGLDAEKSVKALTAAINGFASAGLSANQIVNKLVAVDTAFAVSAQDLAEAFSRAGSTAEDAGVSFDELLGLITAVEQKTARGGAVIGNAFKSIFTRLSRGDTIESLKELGVQIDAAQSGVSKLQALSNALENISDPTVASQIKELAGGVFQINVVSAALKDLSSETSIFAGAAKTASDATNEAFQKNAELNKTIAAQINTLIAGLTSLAERIGSVTFGPLLENLLGLATKFTEFLDKALDPEKGNAFVKGLFKTIGTFLSGPAVVIFTTAFVKIFALVAKFAKDGLKSVFAIGSESSKIKNIEAGIVGLLQKDKQLRQIITSTTASQAQKEQAIINAIKAENNLLRQQAALVQSIAVAARAKGVASFSGATGQFKGRRGKGFASGFQQEEAMAMGLGASNGVRAHFGQGTIGGRRFIMNNQEMEIPNFNGGRDSAVIPMYAAANIPRRKPKNSSKSTGSAAGAASRKKKSRTLFLEGDNYGMLVAKRGDYGGGRVSTSKITGPTQNAIAGLGISNPKGIKKIVLSGLNVRSIEDSTPSFKGQYGKTITKEFSGPLINFGSKMIGDTFKNDEKRNIISQLKKQKGTKLFSSATEGGIFESAIRMGLAGMGAATKFNQNANETAPFDFEEGGRASDKFKRRFGFPKGVSRADAKRSSTGDAARSFIHKILQDGQAKRLAKPKARMAARGHIPRYAKGKSGGMGGAGAIGALFGIQTLVETFGIGTKEVKNELGEVTTELTAFGKGLRVLTGVLATVTTFSGLGIGGGLLRGAGAVGGGLLKGAGAVGSSALRGFGKIPLVGSSFASFLSTRGRDLPKNVGNAIMTPSRKGQATKAGIDELKKRRAIKDLKIPDNRKFGVKGPSAVSDAAREKFFKEQAARGSIKTPSAIKGVGLKAGAKGVGKLALRAAGPVGLAITAAEVGANIGKPIGDFLGNKITEGDFLGAGTRSAGLDSNLAGAKVSDQRALQSLMRETGGSGAGQVGRLKGTSALANAQANFIKDLEKARQATTNGTISLLDRTLAENRFKESVKKAVEKQTRLNNELEKLAPQLRAARGAVKNLKDNLNFSASEGVRKSGRKSGIATERTGIMAGLTLPEGPNAQNVAARIGVNQAMAKTNQSRANLQALQAQAVGVDPASEAGQELKEKIVEASKELRENVIESSVKFNNNITNLKCIWSNYRRCCSSKRF